jgi:hypothetical protein
MKRTTIALALVTLAGTAAAQPAYFPATNSSPMTPPSVTPGSPSTPSGLPPGAGAPAGASPNASNQVGPPLAAGSAALPGWAEQPTTVRGDNPGQGGIPNQTLATPDQTLTPGPVVATQEAPRQGPFPNQTLAPPPGLAVATPPPASAAIIPEPTAPPQPASGNAPGSENAVRLILADGYKSPQGVTRGPDGRWRGQALRGTTLVDVSVDGRGNVTSP